ncbi:prepilin peptidase [Listeria newyorkensis]|uniref:Prepilin peptidase n=1 Tax=Listeria newyorkensis TaxID=1497681 RepID=A0A841YVH9_9LIST|nr:prepilin peptidase [Listeria newyorkensis]MBC1456627.1 prepilin peptidase [Listeria newyorkensis]
MIYFILSVYSLVLASFLHVVGMNYPLRKPFLRRISSECDYCGEKLQLTRMLPIASFVLLKGRTGCCNQPMSWSYFIVEMLSPVFVCILYGVYGFESSFYLYIFIFSLLLILYVSDVYYLHIPNMFLFVYFLSCASYYGYVDLSVLLQHMYQLILGTVVFVGIYLFARKGFGFGDIKLLILLCFLLSLKEAVFIFIIAVFSGAILIGIVTMFQRGMSKKQIPFVPFILFGFLLCPFANDFFWELVLYN